MVCSFLLRICYSYTYSTEVANVLPAEKRINNRIAKRILFSGEMPERSSSRLSSHAIYTYTPLFCSAFVRFEV
jgi:hypothetical protein